MAREKEAPPTTQATTEHAAPADSLARVITATRAKNEEETAAVKGELGEFLARALKSEKVVTEDSIATLNHWIGDIDTLLTAQVNEIMHHPEFQRLESTWRGLHYLVHQDYTEKPPKVRVLNVSKEELANDLEMRRSFDSSVLFKKVFGEEFDQFGGEPFGLLLGDYEIGRSSSDIKFLQNVSQVAEASHAPFVAAASPDLFGLDSFTHLPTQAAALDKIFADKDRYAVWNSFRDSGESRYAVLTLPRVLARLPYGKDKRVEQFSFNEAVDGTEHNKYLWMNAAWALGVRCAKAFDQDGWFGRTRGPEGGGLVEGLPVHLVRSKGKEVMKCPTEVLIQDTPEKAFSDLGFLALLHAKGTDYAAFFGAQSVQKPGNYADEKAATNAQLSAKYNHILSVSRFAHYLKVMIRRKIGRNMSPADCQVWLNQWLVNYIANPPENYGEDELARRPLRDGRVAVTEYPGRPGWYRATAHLVPHSQLEGMDISLRLVGKIPEA